MDKKRSAFAAPDAGRMADVELSKRLGGSRGGLPPGFWWGWPAQ